MATTILQYATSGVGSSLTAGDPSYWTGVAGWAPNVGGTPNGTYALNTNSSAKRGLSVQRLTLNGYSPQAAILAANGGKVPYALDFLRAQVTFQIHAVSDYTAINVVLLGPSGATIATGALDLTGVVADSSTLGWVKFTTRADGQWLSYGDLAGCKLAIDVHWSATAPNGAKFQLDAVGVYSSFTAHKPDDAVPLPLAGTATIAKLLVYDRDGNNLFTLPWTGLSRTIVRNGAGAISATVPRSLLNDLPDEPYLRVIEDGQEAPEFYILDDDGDDDADVAGAARNVTIGGRGALGILDWAEVYPWRHTPGANPAGMEMTFPFTSETPGFIMATLIDRAQARGCLPQLTYSFTADVDSAGQPWPTTWSRAYNVGDTLLKTLSTMADDGWADFEMVGFRLDMYVPDTELGKDYPNVLLRLGQGVVSGPRKRSRKAIRSVLLSDGAQGAIVEEVNAAAVARYGRREGYAGHAGITDVGTLIATATADLSRQTAASEALTLGLEPSVAPALPRPGCYVRYDQRRLDPTHYEPMRVQTIARDYAARSLSIELNDLWMDNDVRMARRVNALLNGSSANERVPQQPYTDNGVPPAKVGGLAIDSSAYIDPNGHTQAQVTATWVPPTLDKDGSPLDDLDSYQIQYELTDAMPGKVYTEFVPHSVPPFAWSPVIPDTAIRVRIAASDREGNLSDWSDWVTGVTGADTTPPGKPTVPQVSNYMGLLRVSWDGAFADGTARPPDFRLLEVHVSALDGFVPTPGDPGTLLGTIFAPSTPVFANVPTGQARYVKFIALDVSGNASPPSDEGSGSTAQVVSSDIFDGAVGSSKLADLAVTTAKINNLAVNTAQVGGLDVGVLNTGILTAQVTVAGSISTNVSPATTGGVQINGMGIYAWAPPVGGAAPVQTVAIDTSGNATLTGTYRTAFTGRRIEILSTGSTGAINFYNVSGAQQSLSADNTTGYEGLRARGGPNAWTVWHDDNEVNTFSYKLGHVFRDYFIINSAGDILAGTGANQVQRVGIDSNGLSIHPSPTNGVSAKTQWAPNGEVTINFGATSAAQGWIVAKTFGTTGTASGGGFLLFNSGGYGIGIKFSTSSGGLEVRGYDDASWQPVSASAFTVNSDARGKTGIVDANLPALDLIRAARVRRYTRTGAHRPVVINEHGERIIDPRGKVIPRAPEIGLIAQEAPAEIVTGTVDSESGLGINLYAAVALLIGAVQQLDSRINPLEEHA